MCKTDLQKNKISCTNFRFNEAQKFEIKSNSSGVEIIALDNTVYNKFVPYEFL